MERHACRFCVGRITNEADIQIIEQYVGHLSQRHQPFESACNNLRLSI